MDIKMPEVSGKPLDASAMKRCTMYLAVRGENGNTVTLMRVDDEVVVFERGSLISFISPDGDRGYDSDWINDYYTIIREYQSGDSLTLTA